MIKVSIPSEKFITSTIYLQGEDYHDIAANKHFREKEVKAHTKGIIGQLLVPDQMLVFTQEKPGAAIHLVNFSVAGKGFIVNFTNPRYCNNTDTALHTALLSAMENKWKQLNTKPGK